MSKFLSGLISIAFCALLVQSQVSPINYLYTGSTAKQGNSASFYDTDSFQVYVTSSGYSVVNKSSGVINVYPNPSCVGTNNSQFFCVDQVNPMNFNQVDLSSGVESASFTFNKSIIQLYSYFNSVLVQFDKNFKQVAVMIPPMTTPVCMMNLSKSSNNYQTATYFNDTIFLTYSSSCSKSPCPYDVYYCANNSIVTVGVTYSSKAINNGFNILPMFFSNPNASAIVAFPINSNGNSDNNQAGVGYILLNGSSSFINSTGAYASVIQVNQTNILITYSNFTTVQFAFNFSSGLFVQSGNTLLLPITNKKPVILASPALPTLIAVSGLLELSNVYVNLSSMSIMAWRYLEPPLQTFGNGSFYVANQRGYIVGSNNMFYLATNVSTFTKQKKTNNKNNTSNGTNNGNTTNVTTTQVNKFINYNTPQAFPNMAFSVQVSKNEKSSGTKYAWNFIAMNLQNISQTTYYPINLTNMGDSDDGDVVSVMPNGTGYVFAVNTGDNFYFASTSSGLLNINENSGEIESDADSDDMVFMNPSTNMAMYYSESQSVAINLTSLNVTGTSSVIQQFSQYEKINEAMFLGWSTVKSFNLVNVTNGNTTTTVNQTIWNLNVTIVDAFAQTIIQNFLIPNIPDPNIKDYLVSYVLNPSTQSITFITVSWIEGASPQNWILSANGTISTSTFGIILPGPYQSLQACQQLLNKNMVNCTISRGIPTPYVPPQPNPNPTPTPAPIPVPSENVTIKTLYNKPTYGSNPQFCDVQGYQVYMTSEGYTVLNTSNGALAVYSNPSCVGTSAGQFYCIDQIDSANLNQADITTGIESNLLTFPQAINQLYPNFNNILAVFDPDFYQIQVITPPSTTLTCQMDLTSQNLEVGFVSALYYSGTIFLDAGDCYAGYCNIAFYTCSNSNLQQQGLTYSTTTFPNDFELKTVVMSANGNVAVIGFPITGVANNGYFDLLALNYVTISWSFVAVMQINQTNILVTDGNGTSVQYYYDFTNGQFVQIGNTFNIPDSYESPTLFVSIAEPTLLAISNTLSVSNFYASLTSMTIFDWVYSNPAQTFTNGSAFAFHTLGYIVGSPNDLYYWSQPNNYTYFYSYVNPTAYPGTAYAIGIQPYGTQYIWELFTLNLDGTSQPNLITIPTDLSINQFPQFSSLTLEGSNYLISVTTNDVTYFMSTQGGLLYTLNTSADAAPISAIDGRVLETTMFVKDGVASGSAQSMVFTNANTGIIMYYYSQYTLTIQMSNFQCTANTSFSQNFNQFSKLSENLFLGWSFDQFTSDLNISVVDAFSEQLVQNIVLNSTGELDISSFVINANINNETQDVSYITVSATQLASNAKNWLIFPNNTVLFANYGDVMIPGPDGAVQICSYQLGGNMMNCTLLPNPDSNVVPSPDDGSSSSNLVLVGIAVLAVILLGGAGIYCVRRKRVKQGGNKDLKEDMSVKNGVQMTDMNV